MLPRKKFENLHAVMAVLVLFEYFLRKFCLNFLTAILTASPNMMHFDRLFSIMRTYGAVLLNTAKYDEGLQIDLLNTAKNDKGLGIMP